MSLAKLRPAASQFLKRMPAGNQIYVAMSDPALLRQLQGFGLSMAQGFGPSGKTLEEQLENQLAAGPGEMAGAFGIGGRFGGINVMAFDHPSRRWTQASRRRRP